MTPVLIRLFIALVLAAGSLFTASVFAASAATVHALRTQAFSVCSNVLVYYNPQQDGGDPKHLQIYQQGLAHLQQLAATTGNPQLIRAAADVRDKVAALERQPASEAHLYPNWVNPLLQAQARLDALADAAYRANLPADPVLLALHRQSIDLEVLLLLYQTRVFGSLGVYLDSVNDDTVVQLDDAIEQRFVELAQQWPQQADELARLHRKYAFIRPRLLQQNAQWVPGGAAYYLEDVVALLARLADLRGPAS